MNALAYIELIGHSSIYPPLDDLFARDNIIWRPNLKRGLDTTYFVKSVGVVFEFTISAEELGIEKKSEGVFTLEHVTMTIIEEDKKDGKYTGPLPRGLLQSDSRLQVEEKLGPPTRRVEGFDNYFLDGLVWIAAFEGDKFEYLELAAPSNGKRKYGLCP